ncbi:unnamed protein product [Periconia digitata]|uniref:Uncharacterized protein n=1 Tax=Periconia digitata TaxID=1303443 RepID=A0A9W4XP39_9PLEO|nr:unnamed protein product [Periconia digitata]
MMAHQPCEVPRHQRVSLAKLGRIDPDLGSQLATRCCRHCQQHPSHDSLSDWASHRVIAT